MLLITTKWVAIIMTKIQQRNNVANAKKRAVLQIFN